VNTWKVILATMVIFGTGALTGGLLVKQAQTPTQKSSRSNNSGKPVTGQSNGGNRHELLKRVERELDLGPDQRERVDKIIAASQERTRKLMEPVLPQMKQEMQATKEEIRAVLTPAQAAHFDELMKPHRRPTNTRERNFESYPPSSPSNASKPN
jgi:Spy/CpxP family protein refolding chaperone